jgi:hypothetical protein
VRRRRYKQWQPLASSPGQSAENLLLISDNYIQLFLVFLDHILVLFDLLLVGEDVLLILENLTLIGNDVGFWHGYLFSGDPQRRSASLISR